MNTDLAYSFFEFAEDNLKVAKFLKRSEHYIQSLYHLCQVFEKIIKSYYILVKTRIEHNPQKKIYNHIIGISHEIEDTSLDLLIEIANIEKQKFSQKANSPEGASHPRFTERYEALIRETNNYMNKLEGYRNKGLDREFVKNVQDYANFVKIKYDKYIEGKQFVKIACKRKTMSDYSANFNMLLNGIMNLYPCLYKMNEITRYPLRDFGYANLSYLHKKNACNNIIIMLNSFTNTYKWILQNPHLL
jgi:HEPN domain-containing protein